MGVDDAGTEMVSGVRVGFLQVDPEKSRCVGGDVTFCDTLQVVKGEFKARPDTQGKDVRVIEASGIYFKIS